MMNEWPVLRRPLDRLNGRKWVIASGPPRQTDCGTILLPVILPSRSPHKTFQKCRWRLREQPRISWRRAVTCARYDAGISGRRAGSCAASVRAKPVGSPCRWRRRGAGNLSATVRVPGDRAGQRHEGAVFCDRAQPAARPSPRRAALQAGETIADGAITLRFASRQTARRPPCSTSMIGLT